jgi:AraC family transcriptional regulator, regulatory protein of adaptative response / methylated-DNA-[protein]-cysteine methyltransferase
VTKDSNISLENHRWDSVVNRDSSAREEFVLGVKTTGIFCRPGCPARTPLRKNVEFFTTNQQALAAGYRACKRCKPENVTTQDWRMDAVVNACRVLESADNPPSLEQLAQTAGVSQWHFHRLFKEKTGVTPKQYAAQHRTKRFRKNLRVSRTITEAIYESGFNASSRAYANAADRLAMTPTHYRRGGKGLTIRYVFAPCSLGWIIVGSTEKGICIIEFADTADEVMDELHEAFPFARLEEAGDEYVAILEEVLQMVENPHRGLNLPLDIHGTVFQEKVWTALRNIQPGTLSTYSEVAERIGKPHAVRAVANACAANKIAIAIPCHRVIRKDGKPVSFGWGPVRRQELLRREKEGAK